MNILAILIVGLVAGFLADKVVKNSFGLIGDILIGIAGSFIGTWLFSTLGISLGTGLVGEIIVAFIGAIVLLLVINMFKRRG
jgi:uncharacterized membrane protein YeaQ/YmgE (transglycosylase-associated protein family)